MFEPSKALSVLLYDVSELDRQRCTALIKKQKSSKKPHKKTGSTISFACLFCDIRAVKDVFHVSFCDASESECQRCTASIEKRKINKNQSENCKKTGSTILSPACFDMFEPSKAFSMFLFMMPANQAASHCNQNQNANDQRCHLPVAFP